VPLAVVDGVTVPHTAAVQAAPFCVSVQLTLTCALESLLTVATDEVAFNAAVAPTGMMALGHGGAAQLWSVQIPAVTVIAGTAMPVEPVWLGSESDVATTTTDRSFAGGFFGAL
jgi:hypothetical protein